MNKVRKLIICVVLLCLASVIAYLMLAWYYSKGFAINTWINGVYCTGKTIEEVNSELLEKTKAPSISIVDCNGKSYTLTEEDMGIKIDYSAALSNHMKNQTPLFWGSRIGGQEESALQPQFSYDPDALRDFWEKLPFVQKEQTTPAKVSIVLTENGYQLIDTTKNRLNEVKGYELLLDCLESTLQAQDVSQENVLDLKLAGAYENRALTDEQKTVLSQWEKVRTFQSVEIVYDMGEEQIIPDTFDLSQFLIREDDGTFAEKEDGSLCISEEKVNAFIDALCDEYDTYGKERTFLSTRGDAITIKKGNYGTLIDREVEKAYLLKVLTEQVSETHVPSYTKEPYHRGKNDIGDTYIEIDMTLQKMYLYHEGECAVETEIVTGCTKKGMGTPDGIYTVYAKQRNRTLKGADYKAFVKYWMPINGNIGIHDASWRSKFGGEIYKKSGSHGCINTPSDAMKQIYESVEVGIPVILF